MKALKILNKILKEINDDSLFLSDDFIPNLEIQKAIAELESLDNRSCENCKYDYIDIDDNRERCNRYYEDKFELKASK